MENTQELVQDEVLIGMGKKIQSYGHKETFCQKTNHIIALGHNKYKQI